MRIKSSFSPSSKMLSASTIESIWSGRTSSIFLRPAGVSFSGGQRNHPQVLSGTGVQQRGLGQSGDLDLQLKKAHFQLAGLPLG